MQFKNLKKMCEISKEKKEIQAKMAEKSIVGGIELPFIDPVDHLNMLEEILNETGG